jgi:hypothetical protein
LHSVHSPWRLSPVPVSRLVVSSASRYSHHSVFGPTQPAPHGAGCLSPSLGALASGRWALSLLLPCRGWPDRRLGERLWTGRSESETLLLGP